MNDESLDAKELEQFKLHGEKIIDREVLFIITPEEAFGYIFQPSVRHHDLIKTSCLTLHIKNIRILQLIRRFIEDIMPHFKGSENDVIEDALRSLILYVWSYYDKAGDAPPLEYIAEFSIAKSWIRREYKKEEETPEIKRWDEVLSSYNYQRTDELDTYLVEFVKTGYIDKPKLADELNKKNGSDEVKHILTGAKLLTCKD